MNKSKKEEGDTYNDILASIGQPKTGGRLCEAANIRPILNEKGWKTIINFT